MSDPDIFTRDVIPRFDRQRAEWLAQARAEALRLAAANGTVTIDDVRAVCPPPADADPRVNGAVFKTPDFEHCGYVRSERQESHQRPVAVFRLAPGRTA